MQKKKKNTNKTLPQVRVESSIDSRNKNLKLEGGQQHVPAGAEVRVVSASVIAQLQAQGLQVR